MSGDSQELGTERCGVVADLKLELSELNPNTRERSEFVFTEGGHWEKNKGRDQTRRFAEFFHQNVRIPWVSFSVLDVGCALGDALRVWHEKYPSAELYGCDVAQTAVKRCQERYGGIARFFRASFEEVQGFWDAIYCSNALEHFEQYVEIAEALLLRCKVLFVLTPFGELRDGSHLQANGEEYHVATFYRNSFDPLVRQGEASRIETLIMGCPRAWGLTRVQKIRWLVGSVLRNRYIFQEPLQILYAIHNKAWSTPDFLSKEQGR
jgi:SAM-dependent methyltransferase